MFENEELLIEFVLFGAEEKGGHIEGSCPVISVNHQSITLLTENQYQRRPINE